MTTGEVAMTKYNNDWITVDGIRFQSKDEARYYELLKEKRAAGLIQNYELQPQYILQPSFKRFGKTVRAITYTADFLVYHKDGTTEIIDIKSIGTATQQGLIRRKMFWYQFPDMKLTWLCRNLKHGDTDGWVEYETLKSIYAKGRRNGD